MNDELTSTQEKILTLLNLSNKNRTGKGWYMGGTCPKCGKNDKFGVKLNHDRSHYKNHVTIHCFHGSCELSGSEKTLFRLIGREDLISTYEYREDFGTLSRLQLKTKEEEYTLPVLKKRYPPLGYKRTYSDSYLESRGFTEDSFKRYNVGRTKIDSKLKDYIVFLVFEDGENKGYIARIDWSRERYSEENKRRKAEGKRQLPKYKNEAGVEFSETIYGIDEIVEGSTHTVILVEGILDKTNVDTQLELYKKDDIKCGCTFGKKISPIQVEKLKNKKVKNIILIYDPDAIKSIKEHSYNLMLEFQKVFVGKLIGEKDPGDMSKEELFLTLQNLETPLSFRINTVNNRRI